jgi:hypothetical protein
MSVYSTSAEIGLKPYPPRLSLINLDTKLPESKKLNLIKQAYLDSYQKTNEVFTRKIVRQPSISSKLSDSNLCQPLMLVTKSHFNLPPQHNRKQPTLGKHKRQALKITIPTLPTEVATQTESKTVPTVTTKERKPISMIINKLYSDLGIKPTIKTNQSK